MSKSGLCRMKGLRKAGLVAIFSLLLSGLYAQRVATDVDPIREYSVALELFQKMKYAQAQERFATVLEHPRGLPSIDQENASYFIALCGLELFNKDGEFLMNTFVTEHSEHPKVNEGNFHLGKYQFSRKRFRAALEWFDKVDEADLQSKYQEELHFKKGYSSFEEGEFDDAQVDFVKVIGIGGKYRSPALYYNSYIQYSKENNEAALAGFTELEEDKLFGKVVPFYILQILYRQGKNEEVLSYGSDLVSRDYAANKTGEIHRMLGEAHFNLQAYDKAVPELEKGISEMGGNREDRYKLGYAAYRGGLFKKAIVYFKQVATEKDALSQLANYHLGDCYLKTEDKMKARTAFRSASKYVFDKEIQEDALFNFAKLAYELSYDPYNEAIQAFEEYISRNPDSERINEAHEFLLKVYLRTHNYEAALRSIDKISVKNEELKATYQKVAYQRGVELFNDLHFKQSVHFLKRAEKYPIDKGISASTLFWSAEAYARMKRWRQADSYYRLFMEAPGAISLPEYTLAYYGLGYLFFENDKHENAIDWFRKFVDTEKKDLVRVNDGFLRIADSYYLKKQNKQAIDYYDKAIKMGKFDADYAIFQIAVCYGLDGQNASKVETLKAMLENFPETDFAADAKYEIAETYFFTDNSAKAIQYFDKVIAEHPNSSYVRKSKLNKGLLFYNQSSDEKALPLFEDVAENYPATEEAKEALMKIQKIYVEKGDVPGFEKYVADNNFPDITMGALDTSYYASAEFMYLRGDMKEAMKEFKAYNEKFPNGFFSLNAHFYRGEAALELKQYDEAILEYDRVLAFAKSAFTEKALLSAGGIYFYQKRYQEALLRYSMLEEIAEVAENLLEARKGLLRSSYLLNNFDLANEYADKLKKDSQVPKAIRSEAMLISSKCALAQNNLKMAEERFKETLLNSNNEFGAESMYNLAKIHFMNNEYEKSQNLVFEMINIFPGYEKWITKSFLLLADVYVKQNDLFQARLTLQNLIDNYDGELKDEAVKKLKEIEAAKPELQERIPSEGIEVEFEQEGRVRDDIFEVDEDEEYELTEPLIEE